MFAKRKVHHGANYASYKCIYMHDGTNWQMTKSQLLDRASDISHGRRAVKSCENHKNTQNTMKFGRNLIKYMSVQQF